MKRICALLLAAVLLFALAACKAAGTGLNPGSHPGTSTILTSTTNVVPPLSTPDSVTFSNQGKLRISYYGNISGIRYITSASQLPENEAFSAYDDAWFQDHALILITETVTSGSIGIDIDSIAIDEGTAKVTLLHTIPQQCTADMATWLLWAEVDKGLELLWQVENPSFKPNYESQ